MKMAKGHTKATLMARGPFYGPWRYPCKGTLVKIIENQIFEHFEGLLKPGSLHIDTSTLNT